MADNKTTEAVETTWFRSIQKMDIEN